LTCKPPCKTYQTGWYCIFLIVLFARLVLFLLFIHPHPPRLGFINKHGMPGGFKEQNNDAPYFHLFGRKRIAFGIIPPT
jgi:hypothetical protein